MSYRPNDMVDCMGRYGGIQLAPDKRLYWPSDAHWIKALHLPVEISKYLKNSVTQNPTTRIFCNSDMHEPLLEALEHVVTSKLQSELKTFDGAYNVRFVRGSSTTISLHSYGLAVDFNAKDNPLGGKSNWSDAFVRCFTDVGFTWGGDFKTRKDPQHFQWCGTPKIEMKKAS